MAWPLTAYQTMVDGGPPSWSAAFGNALQAGINGIVAGTWSLAALYLDGTGGAVVAPPAGTITLGSAAAGGTAAPTPAIAKQRIYRDMIPLAICRVDAAGALVWGIGVSATLRTSGGTYTVTLANPASSSTKMAPFANTRVTGYTADADITSASVITVTTGPSAGGPLDAAFNLVVWGD